MFNLLGLFSIASACVQGLKEAFETEIPAENWANKDLHHEDIMNGVPMEEIIRNAQRGKYKVTEVYPEPHRDPETGQIIIENNLLYHKDLNEFGAVQTMKWVKQGKYNLTPEELVKERERIEKEYDYLYSLL